MNFSEFLTEKKEDVVSFDFDHTLKFEHGGSNLKTIKEFKKLQNKNVVYVVTSRNESSESRKEIQEFLKKHGLHAKDILFTNGKLKKETLDRINSIHHFDDDIQELMHLKIKKTNVFNKKEWDKYVDNDYSPLTEENKKIIYTAVFLTDKGKANLKKHYRGELENIFSHHTTLSFGVNRQEVDHGETVTLKAVGYAKNDEVEALVVELPKNLKTKNKVAHITLSTAKGIKPFASNKLLENGYDKITPFNIEGVVGYFDGKSDINI